MTIFGVALLAFCTLVGVFVGDLLGIVLGVKANVGGVGLAMMLLMAARVWLIKKGGLSHGIKLGVEFWAKRTFSTWGNSGIEPDKRQGNHLNAD